jgi:two-component system, sensor histidine kinase PdtaS
MKPILLTLLVFSIKSFAQVDERQLSTVKDYEDIIKHFRYYKPDSATYFAKKAMAFVRQRGDSSGVASILLQQGMIDDNEGRFDNSEKKYEQALDIFRTLNSKKGIASTLVRMGVVQVRNGNYDKAIGHFLNALKTSEEIKDTFGLMEANYSISWAYLDQKKYDLALHYLKLAEVYNEQIPFSNITLNIYNHFGAIYTFYAEFKKAEYYLQKGIQLSQQPEYQGLNINMLNNLASAYSKQGLIEKAVRLQEEALARSRKIGNYLRELQSLLALSKTYTENDPQKAIYYLNQAILLSKAKKVPRQEIRYLDNITSLYKSQGNYKEALAMKERQYILADSFFFKKMSQNIESLKAEYELSKSTAKINELNYLNNKNQLELKNSGLLRNITFAGIAVLLIISALLYNQNWMKRKSNTEINKKNISLQHLLEEKEWLLKEIHHRVKNNLQIVMSLLNSQSAYLKDSAALDAIKESQHRVHAISLIHQKLYQSENLAVINMSSYIKEVVDYLSQNMDSNHNSIRCTEIQPIELDVAQAVPVGLIINEAVTNSIKYAFPHERGGQIEIQMRHTVAGEVLLLIQDDGIGLPEPFNWQLTKSLGMSLMQGLSKQIDGELKIGNNNGVTIQLKFMPGTTMRSK